MLALLYLFIEPILVLSIITLVDRVVLVLSLIAVVIALFTMALPAVKENIVSKNLKRLESFVESEKKPLLKSLIKIKAKNRS